MMDESEISIFRDGKESDFSPAFVSLGLWSNRKRMNVFNGVFCFIEAGQTSGPKFFKQAVLERLQNLFVHLCVNATFILVRGGFLVQFA